MKESGLSMTDVAGCQLIIILNLFISIIFVKILSRKLDDVTQLTNDQTCLSEILKIEASELSLISKQELKVVLFLLLNG